MNDRQLLDVIVQNQNKQTEHLAEQGKQLARIETKLEPLPDKIAALERDSVRFKVGAAFAFVGLPGVGAWLSGGGA